MEKLASAVIGLTLVLGTLVAACAPAAAPTPTPRAVTAPTPEAKATSVPASSQTSPKDKPRYGGILFSVNKDDVISFDLHQEISASTTNPLMPIYNLLVRNDPADEPKIVPDLAESWEISPDGKVYTFHLRKGVKFHDGMPLTAADVKASFERIAWPPTGVMSQRKGNFSVLEKVESPDDYTVKFTIKYPLASFLQVIALPFNVVMPKHILDKKGDMKKDAVGTGPFKFRSYLRGVSFEEERNPDYFVPGRPYLDGITWYVIKDLAAIDAAFTTHRLHLVHGANHPYTRPLRTKLLERIPNLSVQSGISAIPKAAFFNVTKKPWDEVRMRRAMSLAFDRQAAVQIVFQGDAAIGGYLTPGPWAISQEELLKTPGYRQPKDADIAEAKRLVAEAGYAKGFKATVITRNWPDYVSEALLVKEAAGKIGGEIVVQPLDGAALYSRSYDHDFETLSHGVSATLGEPDLFVPAIYATGGGSNYSLYSNPKVDELSLKQSRTMDPQERKKLVLEIQRVLTEDVPLIPYFWKIYYAISWPEVRDFYSGTPLWLGSNKYQDVWLAQ